MKKILVALSGGVDSTVTAYLLKQKGHHIEGVYMKLFDDDAYHDKNIHNIELVAKFLDIKYHILDVRDDFKKEVYDNFIETYKKGETPNPCVICNRKIKLGKLVEFAKEKGFDFLATGHYAKIENAKIVSAKDITKDQSYFLSNVKKEVLNSVMFPLGDMRKEDVKNIAKEIPVLTSIAKQKESTEICFVPNTYLDILQKHFETYHEGDVLNQAGEVIGHHFGYMRYTIGQRKGFRLKVAHQPHYVLKIIPEKNQIVVGKKDELLQKEFFVKDLNLLGNEEDILKCQVKIRYRSPKVGCTLYIKEGRVVLDEEGSGITPSQVAAFYHDDEVLGSGIII